MSRLIGRTLIFTILSIFNALFTQAMNCEQAASAVEKTICANPEVKAADEELNRQYKAMGGHARPIHNHQKLSPGASCAKKF